MNENTLQAALGEYTNQGYYLKEYDDHVVTVNYKDAEIAAYPQQAVTTTPEALRDCCRRHQTALATAEVAR